MMEYLGAYATVVFLIIGTFAARKLERALASQAERVVNARSRAEGLAGQNRVAAARLAEGAARLQELRERRAVLERETEEMRQLIQDAGSAATILVHVFDRRDTRGSSLFTLTVQSIAEDTEWTGQRTYLLAAAGPEDAADRVAMRFTRAAGFRVSEAKPYP